MMIIEKLRSTLRRRRQDRVFQGKSEINLAREFDFFLPSSGGNYKMWEPVIIKSIQDFVPSLVEFGRVCGDVPHLFSPEQFAEDIGASGKNENKELGDLFNKYGSDKANAHNYDTVYSAVLEQRREDFVTVFEIGLGTNNIDVVSNMGKRGRPGASLRAFSEYLPSSQIFGADLDRRVLFNEGRIKTFFVDQMDVGSFLDLGKYLPTSIDLMIDDGLHAPTANLNTLRFFLGRMPVGGFSIIEDIPERALPFWSIVGMLLPREFGFWMVKARAGNMFVVKRLS